MTSDPITSDHPPFWREHVGLALSAAVSMLLVLKITAVGNFEAETALTIVQVQGTSTVLIAGLIAVLPSLIMQGLVEAVLWRLAWLRERTGVEKATLFMAASLPLGLVVAIVPLALLAAVTVGALLVLILRWILLRVLTDIQGSSAAQLEPMSAVERGAVRATMLTVILFLTVNISWMPTESVSVGGGEAVPAFVIGERGDETVFLPISRSAGVESAPTEEVQRLYCDERSWMSVTAFSAFRKAAYPDCPDYSK